MEKFIDEDFPPTSRSLGFRDSNIVWKRPEEIVENPHFVVDGISNFDVAQGQLGDCWFLAGLAGLSKTKFLERVVPKEQPDAAVGKYYFNFYHYGHWTEVYVDDYLPTKYGQLIYLSSKSKNEFWSALMEKAYAKLHNSYKALDGGTASEAMEDLTGGVCEYIEFRHQPMDPEYLYGRIYAALMSESVCATAIQNLEQFRREYKRDDGLVEGHAYSINKVARYVNTRGDRIPLVRLMNPWGEKEWNGDFSDGSYRWEECTNMSQIDSDNGEFWMSLSDYMARFTKIEICHCKPLGKELQFKGKWSRAEDTAGGRPSHISYKKNPIIIFSSLGGASVVSLTQMHCRETGRKRVPIGFDVYSCEFSNGLELRERVFQTKIYTYARNLTSYMQLHDGQYAVIPSTWDPTDGEFSLRIFTDPRSVDEKHEKAVHTEVDSYSSGTNIRMNDEWYSQADLKYYDRKDTPFQKYGEDDDEAEDDHESFMDKLKDKITDKLTKKLFDLF